MCFAHGPRAPAVGWSDFRRKPGDARSKSAIPLPLAAGGRVLALEQGIPSRSPRLLGLRVSFNAGQTAWLRDGAADWFWPAAEKAGIPVMFLAPGNLPIFAGIAE